jgi:D-sedoheptulose 7-phosphate isomerase
MDFKFIFKRQIEALANKTDCIIFISTSGNSENIIEAAKYAKKQNIHSIALTGNKGGRLIKFCNQSCIIKSKSVARIQETHIFILHHICEVIDDKL